MFGRAQRSSVPVAPDRPRLELSGPRLRRAVEALVAGADTHGGIERYLDALKLKSAVFREALAADGAGPGRLDVESLRPLCAFMPTVRRRIVPWLEDPADSTLRAALERLLEPARDTSGTDERIAALVNSDKIKGISGIRDESDLKEPVRLIVELKRDADPDIVLNQLYQFSPLQDTIDEGSV